MYRISVAESFSSAHKLPQHQGKCKNLHGHNWTVQLTLGAKSLNESGMVADFSDVKSALKKVCDQFDHCFINEIPPFDRESPTAENLAKTFYDLLSPQFDNDNVKIVSIKIAETANNVAEFQPD